MPRRRMADTGTHEGRDALPPTQDDDAAAAAFEVLPKQRVTVMMPLMFFLLFHLTFHAHKN